MFFSVEETRQSWSQIRMPFTEGCWCCASWAVGCGLAQRWLPKFSRDRERWVSCVCGLGVRVGLVGCSCVIAACVLLNWPVGSLQCSRETDSVFLFDTTQMLTPSLSSPEHHLHHHPQGGARSPLTQSFPEREGKERSATQLPLELPPLQRLLPPPRWPLPLWRRLRATWTRKMERKARA